MLTLPATGTDGLATKNIVINTVPRGPTLYGPANAATGQSQMPAFSWSAVGGASSYEILVATVAADLPANPSATSGGPSVVWSAMPTWTCDSPSPALAAGVTYYWEVHALTGSQWGQWSSVYSFTTAAASLAAPVLVGPGSAAFPGQPVTVTQPTFQWQTVPGADQYALYIRQMNADGSQGAIVFDSQTAGVTISGSSIMYVLPSGFLQDGGYYRWNMESHGAAGWSTAYSTPLYFSVAACVGGSYYNAAAAVAYAEKYAYTVCSDGYFWKSASNAATWVLDNLFPPARELTGGWGMTARHFVSCCIGSEPHQGGGGLPIQHYPGDTSNPYGDCNAHLINQLIGNGLATQVSSLSDLVPGDIVAFLTNAAVTHVTLYVATDTVAQHSSTDSAIDTVVANPQVEEYIHITARQPPNLQPPTGLSATVNGTTGATFSWSPIQGATGCSPQYQVIVSTSPSDIPTNAEQSSVQPVHGFNVTLPADQTNYTWTADLSGTAGQVYYWTVRALSNVGTWLDGLWSGRGNVTPPASQQTLTITPLAGVTYAAPIEAGGTYSIQPGSGDLSDPPTMPELEAYVTLAGAAQDPATTQFTWTADVSYDPTQVASFDLSKTSAKEAVTTQTQTCQYTCKQTGPDCVFSDDNLWKTGTLDGTVYPGIIWGGSVSLTVSATINGVPIQSAPVTFQISGIDGSPGRDNFRSYVVQYLQQNQSAWRIGSRQRQRHTNPWTCSARSCRTRRGKQRSRSSTRGSRFTTTTVNLRMAAQG